MSGIFLVEEAVQIFTILTQSISSCYVTAKIFLTSKFSYLLFSNPAHKIETETAQTGGRLLIANYMEQSL
jgi:hypothetical protein